jgi:hypothetical protein
MLHQTGTLHIMLKRPLQCMHRRRSSYLLHHSSQRLRRRHLARVQSLDVGRRRSQSRDRLRVCSRTQASSASLVPETHGECFWTDFKRERASWHFRRQWLCWQQWHVHSDGWPERCESRCLRWWYSQGDYLPMESGGVRAHSRFWVWENYS